MLHLITFYVPAERGKFEGSVIAPEDSESEFPRLGVSELVA